MVHTPHAIVREKVRRILLMPSADWPELNAKLECIPSTIAEADQKLRAQQVIADEMDGARRMC